MSDPATAWPAARPTGIEPIQHPAWEDVRNGVLDLAAEGPVTVVIIGEPGTGKTWLLQELASSLAEHGFPTMMLMRGDLPMAVSPGAALLVDEAGLMSDAARADMTEQQHGVVVLAAQDWPGSDVEAGPVVLELRPLHPDELPLFASRWLRRAGLPPAMIDTNALHRQAAESGYAARTVVQLLRAAAATNAVLQTQAEPARFEPVAAELDDALPVEPMPLPVRPRRRALVRPALAISAIAAAIVLGWALLPATPPAQLAQDTPAPPVPAPPTLADAAPAAPSLPPSETANPATPPIVADAPTAPAESTFPVIPPVRQAEIAEPASEPVVAEASPATPLRQAEPVSPPVAAEAPAPAPPVREAESVNTASEPLAAQTAPSTPPALPPLRQAEIVNPTIPPAVAEATPAPAALPPLRDAAVPDPALVTVAAPPPLAAPLAPPEAGPVTAPPELSASTTALAAAAVLPPPALAKPQPAVVSKLEPPLAVPAPAAPRGGPGLVLVAQRGDTLQSLYGSVYRDRNAPAYAAVKAANPGPFKPGAILIFPEPPGGWQRVQR